MERPLTRRPFSIQDENYAIHRKKSTLDGKSKTSKPAAKKGGQALENRKALHDITNKSSIKLDGTSKNKSSQNKKSNVEDAKAELKKKSSTNEKFNIAEECFLHDHSKCIKAQQATWELNFWDTVLPGHDSAYPRMEQVKSYPDTSSMRKLEELSMSETSSPMWNSPPSSPMWSSPPSSPKWNHPSLEFDLLPSP